MHDPVRRCAAALGLLLGSFVLVSSSAARAESAAWGGFGQGSIGFVAGSFGDLEDELAAPTALGEDFTLSPLGITLGGGGRMILAKYFLIGGGGRGVFHPTAAGSRGSARLVGGGGGLLVGGVVINDDGWLLYPYAGISGYGFTLKVRNSFPPIDNSSSDDVVLGDKRIAPRSADDLATGFATFDLGIGGSRLLFDSSTGGGWIVGADLGFTTAFVNGGWTDEAGEDVAGLADLKLTGFFFRLNLGGGGFKFSDD
jgi:hypothetical protein